MAPCTLSEARGLVLEHHYARGCSNTAVYTHGLYRNDTLVGAAIWLPPTRVCAESVHPEWRSVFALSRLVVAPTEPQNAESILVGGSLRLIRKEGRASALVTYADESQGHTGVIYRATNWTYVGRTQPEMRWVDADGRQVARKATRTRTKAEMLERGYVTAGRHSKHKFVLVLKPVAAAA